MGRRELRAWPLESSLSGALPWLTLTSAGFFGGLLALFNGAAAVRPPRGRGRRRARAAR